MAGTVYDKLITFNTYKQAPTIKNITSLFNGRVGDQGVRLATRWLQGEEGTEVKIAEKGMFVRAYMVVGNGKPDGLGGIMMADGSDTIIVDGDQADVYDHGIAVLQLPKQMFPQDGYAKGYFALVDDLDNIWSSVDVWFKVQGGLPTMGLAAKYYVTRWEMEIDQARQKNEDFQKEMRNTYNQQVTDAQNALTRASSDLSHLSESVGAVQAQINAGDVVTLKQHNADLENISTKIDKRLDEIHPNMESFANLDAVKAKYPNGADGLFVTDDGHRAVYRNGQWIDGGVYQAAGLNKQVSDKIKSIEQRNLIRNAEFTSDLTEDWTIEPSVSFYTDPLDKFHGHIPVVLKKTSSDTGSGGVSSLVTLPTSTCSLSAQAKWSPDDENSYAFITLSFFASPDGSDSPILQKTITLSKVIADWQKQGIDNLSVPWNAQSVRFELRIQGTGTLKIAVPLLTSWLKNAPYDIEELYQDQLTKSKTNLINNADFNIDPMTTFATNFPIGSVEVIPGKGDPVTGAQGFRGRNVLHVSKKDGKDDFQAISFKVTNIVPGVPLSYELFMNFAPTGKGVMFIDNTWLDANGAALQTDHVDLLSYYNNMWNDLKKENLTIPSGASTLSIYIAINQGDLYLACPRAVNDTFIGGYTIEDTLRQIRAVKDDNLINDMDFNYFPLPNEGWYSSLDLSKISIGKDYDGYQGHNSLKLVKDDGNVNAWGGMSAAFNFTSGRSLSELVIFKLHGQANTSAVISIDFMDGVEGNGNSIAHSQQMFTTQDEWIQFVQNDITVPVGTNSVRLGFLINQGTLWIAMPTAVESKNVGLHDYDMLSKQVTDHLKIPIVRLSALDTNPLSADAYQNYRMEWIEPMRTITGYAKLAWQGDSSLNLEKKNYKFKLFSDEGFTKKFKFKPYPEFYKSNTFHLKANFTNCYLINNGYNADMYRQFIFANDTAPQKLINASHQGMICARPVLVYLNSQFMGVYTVNTKKGSDLYNTDEKDKNQIAIQSNGGEGARWTKAVGLTFGETAGCDFEIESDNNEAVEPAVGRLASFIVNSSDDDFKKNLNQYFNVNSLLDYIIFADLTINTDGLHVKNATYVTYDAKVWYILPYDLDSTLGSYWDPTKPQDPDTSVVGQLNTNLLKRVYQLFRDELKQRVAELRTAGVLDKSKWLNEWEAKVNEIGEPLLETEWQRWPNNPAYTKGTSYNDVLSLINHRFKRLDWDFS